MLSGEDITDTEEYINTLLDTKQNELIRMGVWVAAATFSIAAWTLAAGEGPQMHCQPDTQYPPHHLKQTPSRFSFLSLTLPLSPPFYPMHGGKATDGLAVACTGRHRFEACSQSFVV